MCREWEGFSHIMHQPHLPRWVGFLLSAGGKARSRGWGPGAPGWQLGPMQRNPGGKKAVRGQADIGASQFQVGTYGTHPPVHPRGREAKPRPPSSVSWSISEVSSPCKHPSPWSPPPHSRPISHPTLAATASLRSLPGSRCSMETTASCPGPGGLLHVPRVSDLLSQPDSAGGPVSWLAQPQNRGQAHAHTHTRSHLHTPSPPSPWLGTPCPAAPREEKGPGQRDQLAGVHCPQQLQPPPQLLPPPWTQGDTPRGRTQVPAPVPPLGKRLGSEPVSWPAGGLGN